MRDNGLETSDLENNGGPGVTKAAAAETPPATAAANKQPPKADPKKSSSSDQLSESEAHPENPSFLPHSLKVKRTNTQSASSALEVVDRAKVIALNNNTKTKVH